MIIGQTVEMVLYIREIRVITLKLTMAEIKGQFVALEKRSIKWVLKKDSCYFMFDVERETSPFFNQKNSPRIVSYFNIYLKIIIRLFLRLERKKYYLERKLILLLLR